MIDFYLNKEEYDGKVVIEKSNHIAIYIETYDSVAYEDACREGRKYRPRYVILEALVNDNYDEILGVDIYTLCELYNCNASTDYGIFDDVNYKLIERWLSIFHKEDLLYDKHKNTFISLKMIKKFEELFKCKDRNPELFCIYRYLTTDIIHNLHREINAREEVKRSRAMYKKALSIAFPSKRFNELIKNSNQEKSRRFIEKKMS